MSTGFDSGSSKSPSRTAVTHEEVAIAVKELQLEGIQPSVRNVRARVGRGSNTTINALLKDVLAGIVTPEQQLEQFGPRLRELCLEMVGHMQELADKRLASEREQLEARRQHIEQRWAGLQQEHENAVRDLERERKTTALLEKRVGELEKAQATLQEQLGKEIQAAAEARTQLQSFVERTARAEADAKQARQQRDHYESKMTEQRQLDLERHQQQLGQLQAELNAALAREREGAELSADLSREREGLSLKLDHAQAEHARLSDQLAKAQETVAYLSTEQHQNNQAIKQLASQLSDAHAKSEEKSGLISSLQGQLLTQQERHENERVRRSAEQQSLILNLVAHSRSLYEVALEWAKPGDTTLAELAIAQKEIERLFAPKST